MNTKKLLFALLLFFKLYVVLAQQNKLDLGITGGPSLIFLRGNEIIDKFNEPKIGFSTSLFFQYNFPKIFSINFSSGFERKGSIAKGTIPDFGGVLSTFTIQSLFDYLIAPLLLRASFGDKYKLFINSGPFVGYLIKQTTITQGSNISKIKSDDSKFFKPYDFGISAGCGATVPIYRRFILSIEIRHNLGLYNISKFPVINNGSIKTYSGNFLIGLNYQIWKRQLKSK